MSVLLICALGAAANALCSQADQLVAAVAVFRVGGQTDGAVPRLHQATFTRLGT